MKIKNKPKAIISAALVFAVVNPVYSVLAATSTQNNLKQKSTITATSSTKATSTDYVDQSTSSRVVDLDADETFELIGDLERENQETVIKVASSSQVQEEGDLSVYARYLMQKNSAIGRIESDTNLLSVSYEVPAKFLGFIPTHITQTLEVIQNIDDQTIAVEVGKSILSPLSSYDDFSELMVAEVGLLVDVNTSTSESAVMDLNLFKKAEILSKVDDLLTAYLSDVI